jgi:hypothetical protein
MEGGDGRKLRSWHDGPVRGNRLLERIGKYMTNFHSDDSLNWDPYFIICGKKFDDFWECHFKSNSRKVLFILALGFDPRMLNGLSRILKFSNSIKSFKCMLIQYDEGPSSPSLKYRDLVEKNAEDFGKLKGMFSIFEEKQIKLWSDNSITRRRIGDIEAINIIENFEKIQDYTDIIVDISAMPKGLYFSLIAKILHLLENEEKLLQKDLPNFFTIVSENIELDKLIEDSGIDEEPKLIRGYAKELERSAISEIPYIWIPILGENKKIQLENIHKWIKPDEIYPILPSPSINPRRGDDIITEYHQLLFDEWNVEPKNIVYADESNPFDAYRQISYLVREHTKVLVPLGKCRVAISSDSSKLISLGALLAAYDLIRQKMSVGIINIDADGYDIKAPERLSDLNRKSDLYTLLLYHDERK